MAKRYRYGSACAWAAAIMTAALAAASGTAGAESPWDAANKDSFVFPKGMKVENLKTDFGAVGDGKHDDTAALQKAVNRRNAFVFIPNGTYLVRDRIQFSSRPTIGPTIQGESRDGVIIKLADDAKGFDNPDKPRAVIRLINDGKVSADYFKTKIRNLTIYTGKHRGAIGLNFYANNNGMCRTIRIVGQGAIGLDLSHVLNGPLLVSNVEIEGFDIGVFAGTGPFNSQTMEHIIVRGQKKYGVLNDGECLMIRDLQSTNECPAVYTRGGNFLLVDSKLTGGKPDSAAILCASPAFIRNVQTEGYGHAITKHEWNGKSKVLGPVLGEPVPAGKVTEWLSRPAVGPGGPTQAKSLDLPAEVAPYVPLEKDLDKWVLVDDFGAKGDGKTDDSAAFHKALAAAAKIDGAVVCFRANARYSLTGDFDITGGIARLQGANSYVVNGKGGPCRFRVKDGKPPVVTFDLIDRPLGGQVILVENASSRTMVVNNLRGRFIGSGDGKSFLEDSCARVTVTNPKHRLWVRQLNSEGKESAQNLNDGGTVWILGLKTEGPQRLFRMTGGGKTEVLGGWIYQYSKQKPETAMFEVVDSEASFSALLQWNFRNIVYDVFVESKQNGKTEKITLEDNGKKNAVTLMRVGK